MKVDGGLFGGLAEIPARVRALEEAGYDGAMTAETSHDPFLPLAIAAEHSEKIELMTSIAVAFARNPMILAQIGHDLNSFSKGRFILGLGSQIRPHITKRFSMPWSSPAARMREMILAMRAVWDCWYSGEKLDFRGEFYSHTLMTPMFTPQDCEYGAPRVYLAAVGPLMTEVAAEVADGMIAHAFTTERYLRDVTLPAIERGLAKAGRKRTDWSLTCPSFVVSGSDAKAYEASRRGISQQIAFYASTPAYRPVLEVHGWGALQSQLNAMSKQGKWVEMGELITDEIVEAFAIVGEPHQIAGKIKERYGDVLDRVTCTFQMTTADQQREVMEELKKA